MTTPATNSTEVPDEVEGNGEVDEIEVEVTTASLDTAEPSDGENET